MAETRRVLLVSSSGGHWVQLQRLRPAFEGWDRVYVCTNPAYRGTVGENDRFFVVPEATRWDKVRLVQQALTVLWLVVRTRPKVVVSTGAAPGFFAMLFGRLLRKRTVWVDSVANVDELSLSGKYAGPFSDLWLTQWEHLAGPKGPEYRGSLL